MRSRLCPLLLASVVTLSALTVSAPRADAQARLGPHVGYNFDIEEGFLGLDIWFGIVKISDRVELHGNPELSYYFVDHYNLFSFDFNLPFLFRVRSEVVAPYVSPGLTVKVFDPEVGDSDADLGLNVVGGVLFLPDEVVEPFLQLRFIFEDDSDAELMGGVLFRF
jgi:hypothetical protein